MQDVGLKGLTDSFCRFHVEQIAADIKESVGRVSDLPFNASENANIPTVSYEVGTLRMPLLLQHKCSGV